MLGFFHVLAVTVLIFAGTALGHGHKVVGVSDGDTITVMDEIYMVNFVR